jgi:hypothetical protein
VSGETASEKFDHVIREYIDFVNEQVSTYMDALAGFAGQAGYSHFALTPTGFLCLPNARLQPRRLSAFHWPPSAASRC